MRKFSIVGAGANAPLTKCQVRGPKGPRFHLYGKGIHCTLTDARTMPREVSRSAGLLQQSLAVLFFDISPMSNSLTHAFPMKENFVTLFTELAPLCCHSSSKGFQH